MALLNEKRCWTDRTYLVRETLFNHIWSNQLSASEKAYLDTHWALIEDFLMAGSADEFILKRAITESSFQLQLVDLFAIVIGWGTQGYSKLMRFDTHVSRQLIAETDQLDPLLKSTKHMGSLVHLAKGPFLSSYSPDYLKRVVATAFKKFPSLMKMQYNFSIRKDKKTKNGKRRIRIFTKEDVEAWS